MISVGIPCILAYFMMSLKTDNDDEISAMMGACAIICLLVSMVIYEILVESVGCVFIFYAADKSFYEMRHITVNRFPQEEYNQMSYCSNANPYAVKQGQDNSYDRM